MNAASEPVVLGIVGPCAAGKSTLVRQLRQAGYQARHIAQEHSFAPAMWQRINPPDCLIFLDVSFPISMQRRPDPRWTLREYEAQQQRLRHAREHADFYLLTDRLTPEQVYQQVLSFLSGFNG
ncbi:MAG: hypothetical protein Fur0018_17370 [Anaerolineales bacterium]